MGQQSTRFSQTIRDLVPLAENLRQLGLVDKVQMFSFLHDRGLTDYGNQERVDAVLKGWLSDSPDADNMAEFHPFRFYSAFRALQSSDRVVNSDDGETIDMAVLLEPIYWPDITYRRTGNLSEGGYQQLSTDYKKHLLPLLLQEDPNTWKSRHQGLLQVAARTDSNRELYLLLRLSGWHQRNKLTGKMSAALWIRHVAEVIRRGFEEAHGVLWPEEDETFSKLRRRLLGSERLLDAPAPSRRHLARRFELFSGSAIRWYVEGPTEYFAILEVLGEPAQYGVEIVNLAGRIERDKDNIALSMKEWLAEDNQLRRFSMISFDADVRQNVKTISALSSLVVGSVFAHKPDFEFANFTLEELVQIAADLDRTEGINSDDLRTADWAGIDTGKAFEDKYLTISQRRRPLKGEKWGRALARYAEEKPNRSDGPERQFTTSLRHAVLAQSSNYDHHKDTVVLNPNTFEAELRRPAQ